MGRLFGTDGVRGAANTELTPELAMELGRAGGTFLREHGRAGRPVLIGRDTRISGPMLEAAMIAGLTSAGLHVIKLGIITTPGVAYLTRRLDGLGGIMISASHNPAVDNGIKFFSAGGFKLTDTEEDSIEAILKHKGNIKKPGGTEVGRVYEGEHFRRFYLDHLAQTINTPLKGLKIVVDCANGAAATLAPELYRSLGADVEAVFTETDGCRINVNCGSTCIGALQERVKHNGACLGIAHDGDADRVIAVDEYGRLVDGDHIMAVCGGYLLSRGRLPHKRIAVTVYSNLGLRDYFRSMGGDVQITDNGDRYVLECMQRMGLILGGEQSGHIIFLEHNTTGDGMVSALQLMQVMAETGLPLSSLADALVTYPQVLKNIRVRRKDAWRENAAIAESIKYAEGIMGERGRIFVRASGTEPLIRVMAEGPEQRVLEEFVAQIASVIESELNR